METKTGYSFICKRCDNLLQNQLTSNSFVLRCSNCNTDTAATKNQFILISNVNTDYINPAYNNTYIHAAKHDDTIESPHVKCPKCNSGTKQIRDPRTLKLLYNCVCGNLFSL